MQQLSFGLKSQFPSGQTLKLCSCGHQATCFLLPAVLLQLRTVQHLRTAVTFGWEWLWSMHRIDWGIYRGGSWIKLKRGQETSFTRGPGALWKTETHDALQCCLGRYERMICIVASVVLPLHGVRVYAFIPQIVAWMIIPVFSISLWCQSKNPC